MDRAREPLGIRLYFIAVDELDLHQPIGERHRRLDRVGQPLAQLSLHHQAVDHHGDVVLVLLVERDLIVETSQLAVDLDPAEALGAQFLELLAVSPLRPRTIGASTMKRVPSGSSIT